MKPITCFVLLVTLLVVEQTSANVKQGFKNEVHALQVRIGQAVRYALGGHLPSLSSLSERVGNVEEKEQALLHEFTDITGNLGKLSVDIDFDLSKICNCSDVDARLKVLEAFVHPK